MPIFDAKCPQEICERRKTNERKKERKKESIAHFDKLVDVLIRNDVKDSSN